MKTSSDSLSVLLTVRNAQDRLAHQVERLVETASELTNRFEVLIIDDGSTDATEEIAWELSARHWQVELIRQPRMLGPMAALRAGLAFSTGEYLLVGDGSGCPADEALSALWRKRDETPRDHLHPWRTPSDIGWLERLLRPMRGREDLAAHDGQYRGWRMLQRAALADLAPVAAGTGRSYLDRPKAPHAPLTGLPKLVTGRTPVPR